LRLMDYLTLPLTLKKVWRHPNREGGV